MTTVLQIIGGVWLVSALMFVLIVLSALLMGDDE